MERLARPVVVACLGVLVGCAGVPVDPAPRIYRPVEQITPPAPIPRAPQIVLRPDATVTECQPPDPAATAQKKKVRASFGFQARSCLGLPPDFKMPALVIVRIDPVRGRDPASDAGLRIGDRVTSVNGCTDLDEHQFLAKKSAYTVGNAVEIGVARFDGRQHTRVLTLVHTGAFEANRSTRSAATCEGIGLRSPRGVDRGGVRPHRTQG